MQFSHPVCVSARLLAVLVARLLVCMFVDLKPIGAAEFPFYASQRESLLKSVSIVLLSRLKPFF
jgi:hypothetical protein